MTRVLPFFFLLTGLQAQDRPAEFRWKLAEGDVLVYRHSIDQKFSMTGEGSTFDYAQTIHATERLEVERITVEGNFSIRCTTERVRVIVDGFTVYDSDRPDQGDPKAAELFREAIGKAQAITMTPGGLPVARRGATTQERFRRSLTGGGDEAGQPFPMAVLALPLPEALVNGKRWEISAEEEAANGIRMSSRTTYELDDLSSGRQSVKGSINLSLLNAPSTMKLDSGAGRQRAVFDVGADRKSVV